MQKTTQEQIVNQARTWLGTPFHHQARLKGVGCDCLGLVVGVVDKLGLKDTVASCLAAAIAAKKLIIISDVIDGMNQENKKLSISEARKLSRNKKVSSEIISKLETCLHALENDCEAAHILDGSLSHALLMAIFTKLGAGNMIYRD